MILDHMSDETLVRYCQTDSYAGQLCLIPRIKKRLDEYKLYKTFELDEILNQIEDYTPYPLLIHRYEMQRDDESFIFNDTIYILYQDKYVEIKCQAYDGMDERYLNIQIIKRQQAITLNTIINQYENNNDAVWSLDVMTIKNVYNHIGVKRYASLKAIEELDKNFLYKEEHLNNTIEDYFTLFIIYIWFKSQVILYKLKDDQLDEIDIDIDDNYVDTPEYQVLKYELNKSIDDMYQLLLNYINIS